ncbi:ATP-grasp fold amidoligase family protein [Paraclostridium sordellii]|uniref:ATP-grasp fold amidoligase family protein n=1 Tax=Paraclostridium sordellii TaxID=1505 RepID=UPI0005DEF3A5|nr:ATP-grasp fold amidoligase family protein [Paeniclostridium sordellii]CEN21905.1 glycosyltransferase [[Clostridium] sordellii] [Paeniclostridium sordellii]CEP81803.1 glycosyltransferase [[Clostridium] sordellii] [Paeniclostridium sordellii]CEP88042.1 glycosyltransferase [[Clostridium] sordellii] [Paeniclostridium sordellii]CEP97222.1 glycosyltransferase [[Clostridium] sordellii] [Paeniclostridium sordellii]CEQ00910.1 glycosyltransferase [[Clostridium] sordellii] [Paeniclostridium sordellii]
MKFIKVLKNPYKIIPYMGRKGLLNWVKDETYIKLLYRSYEGKKLNLENPITFNEKLQWLKLNDRNPLYTQLVDKYNVRRYVEAKLGDKYLIPLIGVYDNVDEIDFEKLPKSFVLKCTHDSGSVIVCDDKSKLDFNLTKERLKKSLNRNFYYCNREWPYKYVKPKIVCEKMLDSQIIDYKIFCFNGEPKFLYVGQGLVSDHSLKIDFYDLDWNKMNFKRTDYENFDGYIERPKKLEEMVKIAKKLSKEITFVRIDLYEVEGKLYFSEFTFTPGGGYIPLSPSRYDKKLGDLLKLYK